MQVYISPPSWNIHDPMQSENDVPMQKSLLPFFSFW